MKVKFTKEVEFEGTKYESIDIDLDKLTGHDIVSAETEAMSINNGPVTDLHKIYHVCIAARAAGVAPDMISSLPAKDFLKVVTEVQGFLLGL